MPILTDIVNQDRTLEVDGIELRAAILSSEELDFIKADVSIGHEILRRTGIRNLEKKFESIARVANSPSVLSTAASVLNGTPRPGPCTFLRQDCGPELVRWLASRSYCNAKPATGDVRMGLLDAERRCATCPAPAFSDGPHGDYPIARR